MRSNYNYSFIIPHHNSPDLLNRCIDSIPKREDIQIIVIDDNSDEAKRPQVNRSDVEIIYIDALHTRGAGHARNVGMEHAKGDWLLFADCDDYYSKGFIIALDSYIDKNIDVLYFNYLFINGMTNNEEPSCKLQEVIDNYTGTKEEIDVVKYRNNAPWSKMVRTSYATQHNMYFEEVINGNDVLFSLFVASYTDNIAVCSKNLYNYVKTPNSIGNCKQDSKKILCRLMHLIKHNKINSSIGHPEWNTNIFKYIISLVIGDVASSKINLFSNIITGLPSFYHNRNEWIRIIESHR